MFVVTSIIVYRKLDKAKQNLLELLNECNQEVLNYESLYYASQGDFDSKLSSYKEEFIKKFQGTLSVGDIFHTPDDEDYDKHFRNTTQIIFEIDFENGKFKSKSITNENQVWSNDFDLINEYTWVKVKRNSLMEHKFL
tara:strand:+ start:858 stop:1271 length:414 start_codon:yes stop_codon:yes gene_type:complete